MAKFKRLVLTELGNTTDIYSWTEKKPGKNYVFRSRSNEYVVKPAQIKDNEISVDYMFKDDSGGLSMDQTGEGNPFRVVATVVDIVEYVWKNRHNFYRNPEGIEKIHFTGAPKKGETFGDTARKKLYLQFVKNKFPNAKVDVDSLGGVDVYPPESI
mgnify:CR=1 FL=1